MRLQRSIFKLAAVLPLAAASCAPVAAQDKPAAAADPSAKDKTKPAAAPEAKPDIVRLEEHKFKLGDIQFNDETREITFPAKVNMTEGLLEYIVVHESGKAHEALLTTTARPFDLNVVLLLLSYKKTDAMFVTKDPKAGPIAVKHPKVEPEALVECSISWKDEAGAPQTGRVESWVHNVEKRAVAADGPFVYNGSWISAGKFLAEDTGSIMALYLDAASLINNPRENNDNDDVWIPAPKLPKTGTEVTLTLRPAPAAGAKGKDDGAKSDPDSGQKTPETPSGKGSGVPAKKPASGEAKPKPAAPKKRS